MSKIVRWICLATVFMLFCSVLCGCSGRIPPEEEPVKATLPADGEVADKLSGMVRMLSVNSPIIPEFDDITEAMEKCRDSVLYYMLTKSYGKYTGDIEKLDHAVAEYPRMQITNLIPAREFEETVYASFGGTKKITNESGRLFVYLEKVAAYTSVTMLDDDPVKVSIVELSETENTYRMTFRCEAGGVTSPDYRGIFMKRDDGTVYFYKVEEN